MADEKETLEYLRRIEDQQRDGHKAMADSLKNLELICNTLATQRQADLQAASLLAGRVDDHENRLRKNESILTKVTAFFTIMSTAFGTALAWAMDKIISGGGQ